MRWSRLPLAPVGALALALAAAFAACGGDDEEPTPTTSTQASATVAATAAPKQAATATPSGGGTGGGGGTLAAALCSDWNGVAAQTASFSGPPTAPVGDLRTSMEALDRNLKTFVAQAPSEIRPDVEVLAKFYSEYAAIMLRANYDFTRLAQDPEFQRLATSASDPALQRATTNIQTWVQRNCR